MRKRNISYLADTLIWTLIYLLPILLFACSFFAYQLTSSVDFDFAVFIQNNFHILDTNVIYVSLVDLFGSAGQLPLFDTTSANSVLLFLTYFIICNIAHLAVDFLLFIPRLAHKFLGDITEGD